MFRLDSISYLVFLFLTISIIEHTSAGGCNDCLYGNVEQRKSCMKYLGGPVVSNLEIVYISWDPSEYARAKDSTALANLIATTPALDYLSQYSTRRQKIGRPTFKGILLRKCKQIRCSSRKSLFQNPNTHVLNALFTSGNIAREIDALINSEKIPAPTFDSSGNVNTLYVIFISGRDKLVTMPFGMPYSKDQQLCRGVVGFHYFFPDNTDLLFCSIFCNRFLWTVIGDCPEKLDKPNTQSMDTVVVHEIIETITDPYCGGVGFGQDLIGIDIGWAGAQNSYACENGDLCDKHNSVTNENPWVNYSGRLWASGWSNRDGKCFAYQDPIDTSTLSPTQIGDTNPPTVAYTFSPTEEVSLGGTVTLAIFPTTDCSGTTIAIPSIKNDPNICQLIKLGNITTYVKGSCAAGNKLIAFFCTDSTCSSCNSVGGIGDQGNCGPDPTGYGASSRYYCVPPTSGVISIKAYGDTSCSNESNILLSSYLYNDISLCQGLTFSPTDPSSTFFFKVICVNSQLTALTCSGVLCDICVPFNVAKKSGECDSNFSNGGYALNYTCDVTLPVANYLVQDPFAFPSSSSMSTGAIVGIVVGSVVGFAFVALVIGVIIYLTGKKHDLGPDHYNRL